MQSNTFNVGDRVSLIPFQHKGKVATVKFCGSVSKKFGTWVGLELDEPTGDCSGEVNGEALFECKENHGLLLRNTQVRLLDESAIQRSSMKIQVPPINVDAENNEGGSPLISSTATDPDIQEALLVDRVTRETRQASLLNEPAKSLETGEDPSAKSKGWKDRLEKLKKQKQDDKLKEETNNLVTNAGEDLDNIRKAFAPTSGIQLSQDGQLAVDRTKVQDRPDAEKILKQLEEQKTFLDAPITPEPSSVASSAVGSPKNAVKKVIPSQSSNVAMIKEKAAKLAQERLQRQGATGKTTPLPKTNTIADKSRNSNLAARTSLNSSAQKPGSKLMNSLTAESASYTSRRTNESSMLTTPRSNSRQAMMNTLGGSRDLTKRTPSQNKELVTGRSTSNTRAGLRGVTKPESNRPGVREGSTTARGGVRGTTPMKSTITARTATRPGTSMDKTLANRYGTNPVSRGGLDAKKFELLIQQKDGEIQTLQQQVQESNERIAKLQTDHQQEIDLMFQMQKQREEEFRSETTAKQSQFQQELDALTEKMLNSSDPEVQDQVQIELVKKQLEQIQIKAEQNQQDADEKFKSDVAKLESHIIRLNQELEAANKQRDEKLEKLAETEILIEELRLQNAEQKEQHQNEMTALRLTAGQSEHYAENQAKLKKEIEDVKKSSKDDQERIQSDLNEKIKQLQKNLQSKELELQNLTITTDSKIKKLQSDLDEEQQRRMEEQELHTLEMEALKEEKDEILQKISSVEEDDFLTNVSVEEIKNQNKKLRAAVTSLTFGFEEERKRMEEALKDETVKDKLINDLQSKVKEMDFLLDELDLKEQQRLDMQKRLEEIVEYEHMVDEMVQEISKKDEENDELLSKIKQMEEEHRLLEELNTNLETFNKELNDDVNAKDTKMTQLIKEKEELEAMIVEQDDNAEKLKQRQADMQKQVKVLRDQLEQSSGDTSKDRITLLLEKQGALVKQLRENETKQLNSSRNMLEMWQTKAKQEVILSALPQQMQQEINLAAFAKIQSMNLLKHKLMLLIREICERQLENESYDKQTYVDQLKDIALVACKMINVLQIIQFWTANMSPGQYKEEMKLPQWDMIQQSQNVVDKVANQINESSLPNKFTCEELDAELRHVETLMHKTEKLFGVLTPEENQISVDEGVTVDRLQSSVAYQRRQILINNLCNKVKLRNQALKMAVGASLLDYYCVGNQEERKTQQQKCKLIYLRLLDTILKLDMIPSHEEGDEYLDVKTLNTELRLSQKFDLIRALWEGEDMQDQRQKSWLSVLEAVERDITTLNNDYKYKRLVKIVDQKYGEQKIDFDDLYKVDICVGGPWMEINKSIRAELQDMDTLKGKNQTLQDKQKELMVQMFTLKKERDEASQIVVTLQGKLSQALMRAEQIPALEIEKKDLEQQIVSLTRQVDFKTHEIDKNQKKIEDLNKRLEDSKKQAASAPPPESPKQGGPTTPTSRTGISARPNLSKHSSRQSRTERYFQELKDTNLAKYNADQGHNRQMSQYNTATMVHQLQQNEDVYMNIIHELQYDRLRLKGKDMLERIQKLDNPDSAFGILMREMSKQEIKLNPTEQAVVTNAIKQVHGLKSQMKRQIASKRVIDLTSAPKENQDQAFNFQLAQAKETVNDAVSLLFSNRGGLKENLKPQDQQTTSEIKIGEIKLKGKIQIPQRKVMLDSDDLAQLRRNLQLFQS